MKYKLIGNNDICNPLRTLLTNRGIKDVEGYINLTEDVLIPYQNLNNIDKAVEVYSYHINHANHICILVDPDVDGFTSAAMVYSYTKSLNPNCKLTYILHDGKGHGLTDEITIPDDVDLLIIPDGGTNDVQQCSDIKDRGIDIIILDHHEAEVENPYAIIVNNQCCNYANKNLCGAGIVYKFLQAVDEEMWNDCADDYLDLVALANISDMMDMREPETKYLVLKGLNIITNGFFEQIIESQSYYLPDGLTIIGIQFYVTPYINALIRLGTQEEKDILFRAFIGDESEVFDYYNKKTKEESQETIYKRAVRFCTNAKNRQGKIVDKQMPLIINHIKKKGQDKHEVIITNVTDYLESTMTGVVAIKVAKEFHKPTILLRNKGVDKCNGDDVYGGSVRVPDSSPIKNFKDMLNSMTFFLAQGHPSACGVTIFKHNIQESIETLDDYIRECNLVGIADTPVDFEIDYENFNTGIFRDIAELKPYYGQEIKECNVVINNVPIVPCDITIQGKESNSWFTYILDDSIKVVTFKRDDTDEFLKWGKQIKDLRSKEFPLPKLAYEPIYINILGKLSYSYYKGIKTAQIIIEKYSICA